MFGYIKAYNPDLKISEYELYKSVYCGLCKDMGRRFGLWSRFTLNYDFTFLAILTIATGDKDPCIKGERCLFNPIKRCNCCTSAYSLEYASNVAMLMVWYKLQDNIMDCGRFASFFLKIAAKMIKSDYEKAKAACPAVDEYMQEYVAAQYRLEKELCSNTDEIAEPTAIMLGKVLKSITEDETEQKILYRMGYFLGKYIYLCDALDDFEKDKKHKNYNVFIEKDKNGEILEGETPKDFAKGSLFMTVSEVANAYNLLDTKRFSGILDNIIYLGLYKNIDYLMLSDEERKQKRKNRSIK